MALDDSLSQQNLMGQGQRTVSHCHWSASETVHGDDAVYPHPFLGCSTEGLFL